MSGIFNNIETLNSECFIYENHEMNWGNAVDIDYNKSMDINVLKQCIEKYAVGYCDGGRLIVRPNPKSYAIMFEKDGLRFWFHLEKWFVEDIYNPIELF